MYWKNSNWLFCVDLLDAAVFTRDGAILEKLSIPDLARFRKSLFKSIPQNWEAESDYPYCFDNMCIFYNWHWINSVFGKMPLISLFTLFNISYVSLELKCDGQNNNIFEQRFDCIRLKTM